MSYKSGEIARGFQVHLNKVSKEVFEEWSGEVDAALNTWHRDLFSALNDEVPSNEIGKYRKHRGRLFPYYENAELQNSFHVMTPEMHKTKNMWKYTAGVEVDLSVLQLHTTNAGYPGIKNGDPGAWKGWADDVFGNRGRGAVQGLTRVFDRLTRLKGKKGF